MPSDIPSQKSPQRLALMERIRELEREGLWHVDANEDPETYTLYPDAVDYLDRKWTSRIKTWVANRVGQHFYEKMIRRGQLVIEEVRGIENFTAVKGGKIITSNHFSPMENYAVWRAIRPYTGGKLLYKVIREGNYTNPPKPYGFIMRNCNTLPLSSDLATMKKFTHAFKVLMERGESVLIYPEQSMWYNYRKPKPMQDGAFHLAVRNRVPIVPFFLTMRDADTLDGDGFPIQKYTVNILPAIYPDTSLPAPKARAKMKEENYAAWVKCYEDFYGIPLDYTKDNW